MSDVATQAGDTARTAKWIIGAAVVLFLGWLFLRPQVDMKVISQSGWQPLFGDNEVTVTLRNVGSGGYTGICVASPNLQDKCVCRQRAYFSAGEERTVKFSCPALQEGMKFAIHTWVPGLLE